MVLGNMFNTIWGAFSAWQDVCSPVTQEDSMNIVTVQFDKVLNFEMQTFLQFIPFSVLLQNQESNNVLEALWGCTLELDISYLAGNTNCSWRVKRTGTIWSLSIDLMIALH